MIHKLLLPLLKLTIFLFILFSVGLILGEEQERQAWAEAPSTLAMYTTDQVCTEEASGNVLNCGHCGSCSNRHDIRIYHETQRTLTGIMTDCARNDLLFGQDAFECLKVKVNMTNDCTQCWVMNYHCNFQHCSRTCIKHRMLPFLPSLRSWDSDPLDPCYACDERMCGPGFVGCAGANRRRTGVVSDIERKTNREICDKVDLDWILGKKEETMQAPSDESVGVTEESAPQSEEL